MGLLQGLLGNSSAVEPAVAREELGVILHASEEVLLAYKLVRDMLVLTDRRLIAVNKQGITGAKVSYTSTPYRSVVRFSVETAGHLDLDAELKVWVAGRAEALEWSFTKQVNVYELQSLLAERVARP